MGRIETASITMGEPQIPQEPRRARMERNIASLVLLTADQSFPGATAEDQAAFAHWQGAIRSPHKIISTDFDHTVADRKPQLKPGELTLDASAYLDENGESIELENIDLLLLLALYGDAINIETGKDANAWRVADYMVSRLQYLAEKLGATARYEDSRLRTIDGTKPVILTFTIGNGGYTVDLLAPDPREGVIVYKPIPLSGWEGLQRHSALLRDSTSQRRKDQIAHKELGPIIDADETVLETRRLPPREEYDPKNDPYIRLQQEDKRVPHTSQVHVQKRETKITTRAQLRREVEPELTEIELQHRMMLQADIRDFAIHVAGVSTKVNLALDLDRIVHDQDLNERWFTEIGIKITDADSLFAAFRVLSKDWGVSVSRAFAQGVTYIDIGAPGINKEESARLVKNWVYGLYHVYGVDIPKVLTFGYGDAPGDPEKIYESTNDGPMIAHTGGATNYLGNERPKRNGFPIYLADIFPGHEYTGIELSNLYFRSLFYGRFPHAQVEEQQTRLGILLRELAGERKEQHL